MPGLNHYITRCQSILQAGEPDNDVLVYFPFHDILHDPERELGKHLKIIGDWLTELDAFPVFRQLWQEGWNFDYVSDLQLERTTVESGMLVAESGTKYSSWTASSPQAERFAGTATYSLKFDSPGPQSRWVLDLGTVHASARVHLNGKDLGILISPTFEVLLEDVQPHDNELMVEVTNTAANRVRDLDQRGSKWRDMFDRKTPIFNLVPLKLPKHAMPRFPYHREIVNYANDPPAPAGLLGPVCLLPVGE